jgi:hypothetical protein
VSACTYGCRITGQHRPDCNGDCRGCLPRPAEHGTLCTTCTDRLTEAVTITPELLLHLHAIGQPHASSKALTDDLIHRGDPAESTVLPASWLDEDELDRLTRSWCLLVLDEHPVQGMRGPGKGDSAAGWLLPHLSWCVSREWAGEMRRELVSYVGVLERKWPGPDAVEPPRPVDVPCPRCDLMSLVYTPPRWKGQAFRVECTDVDCARVFSEDEWHRFQALALRVVKLEPTIRQLRREATA